MKRFIKPLFIAYSAMLVMQYLHAILLFINMDYMFHFDGWYLSEWLINYQGGFVRRGVIGQSILYLYNTFNIDIALIIVSICVISTTSLILFTIYFFRKRGLSLFILPNVILLGAFAMHQLISHRRDALMLLIIFLALYLYNRGKTYKDNKKMIVYYALLCISSIFVILTHEASFFCFVPFIALDYYTCKKQELFLQKIKDTTLFILPMLITMGLAVLFHGNEEVANSIWNSYASYFQERFGEMLHMGSGVDALTWTTRSTIRYHLEKNFMQPLFGVIPSLFAWCIIFFIALYIMVNVNKVRLFNYEKENIDNGHLATLLMIQFVSLLPMFTVLSCDLGRIFTYWSLTSFFIFAFCNKTEYPIFSSIGNRFATFCNNNKILQKSSFYILVNLFIMVPFVYFFTPFQTCVLGNIIKFIEDLISYL